MSVTVRTADLSRDRAKIIKCLRENLPRDIDDAWFDWLYLRSPYGQARAWVAEHETERRSTGVCAAFSRFVSQRGQRRIAWVLGDFCVERRSRSLGPALSLQRTCLESLRTSTSVVYDFPSSTMMSVYRRLGVGAVGSQIRYAKLYRVDPKVNDWVRHPVLRNSISPIGNRILELRRRRRDHLHGIDVQIHEGPFDEEFDLLEAKIQEANDIRVVRSARYLNWRYRDHPKNRYRVFVAKRHGVCLGYAILQIDPSEWILADLQAIEVEHTVPTLLEDLDRSAHSERIARMNVPVMEDSYIVAHLRAAGFQPREGAPVVASLGGETTGRWSLMYGDREA